jgi:hypothetical protein
MDDWGGEDNIGLPRFVRIHFSQVPTPERQRVDPDALTISMLPSMPTRHGVRGPS